MFPSPADSARMDTSGTTSPMSSGTATNASQRYQGNTNSLYPDLSAVPQQSAQMEYEEDDVLVALGVPPAKSKARPARPPPPSRSNTAPVGSLELSTSGKRRSSPIFMDPSPLYPHELRWFYKEPGKFWQPMRGGDSLVLEQTYLSLSGMSMSDNVCDMEVDVMGGLYVVDVPQRTMKPIYWTVKEDWKVLRGLWYEIVGDKWYPFTEIDCSKIEEEHVKSNWREKAKRDAELQQWAHSPSTTRASLSGGSARHHSVTGVNGKEEVPAESSCLLVNKLSLEKYDIHWMANGDMYKMKTELSSQIWNKVGEKFGKGSQFGSTKVVRGYKEHASGEDRLPPIGHVVFVVHGIGQNMDMSSIEKSASDFREVVTKVAKKSFCESWRDKRVEFLPVDWRTWLTLDKGLVSQVTPPGLKMFRGMVNDCVMDILYYFSPIYGPEILDGLKFSLQKQYNEFMRRHPHFLRNGGSVSVIGHSLGSVLMFDLLREKAERDSQCQVMSSGIPTSDLLASPDSIDGQMDLTNVKSEMEKELMQLRRRVSMLERQLAPNPPNTLTFNVDHLFIYGSPLALFVAMKEPGDLVVKDHRSAASILPPSVCKRLHNVHHPSDPIAYRMEPLINSLYAQVRPVKLETASSSKISQEAVDHAEGPMTDDTLKEKHQQQGKSWWSGMKNSIVSYASAKIMGTDTTDGGGAATPTKTPVPDKMIDSDKKFLPEERLRERLDFVMREGLVENSYFNSLTAHFSYWTSADVAQHLLLQLYKYKPS